MDLIGNDSAIKLAKVYDGCFVRFYLGDKTLTPEELAKAFTFIKDKDGFEAKKGQLVNGLLETDQRPEGLLTYLVETGDDEAKAIQAVSSNKHSLCLEQQAVFGRCIERQWWKLLGKLYLPQGDHKNIIIHEPKSPDKPAYLALLIEGEQYKFAERFFRDNPEIRGRTMAAIYAHKRSLALPKTLNICEGALVVVIQKKGEAFARQLIQEKPERLLEDGVMHALMDQDWNDLVLKGCQLTAFEASDEWIEALKSKNQTEALSHIHKQLENRISTVESMLAMISDVKLLVGIAQGMTKFNDGDGEFDITDLQVIAGQVATPEDKHTAAKTRLIEDLSPSSGRGRLFKVYLDTEQLPNAFEIIDLEGELKETHAEWSRLRNLAATE